MKLVQYIVCVLTNATHLLYDLLMKQETHTNAEVNIHLRAKAHDRLLIDQAAELLGSNRSQFMLSSALKEAKSVILDQTSFHLDNQAFQKVLDWLDAPATKQQTDGMNRLRAIESPWTNE